MNFGFDAITIWSRSGQQRQLKFERNRVNVLTGWSHTGKSALLDIIDYCFLASSHKLPDSVINENVGWYGLTFYINDKTYTLARRSPIENDVSKDYYFSSSGTVPEKPETNTAEADIRLILESEFSIDDNVKLSYGGGALRANSKVSFRYFFLFNTISEDIITNSRTFFDKQSEDRYREALPRIFDMALGIDDIANMNAREQREALKKELQRLERKSVALTNGRETFDEEIREIALKAAEYGLLDAKPSDVNRELVQRAIESAASLDVGRANDRYAQVNTELISVNRRLRKLHHFTDEYRSYKGNLQGAEDSLRPIQQLISRASEVVKSEIFDELISCLKADLVSVKASLAGKQPVDGQIQAMIKKLEAQRENLQRDLALLPQDPKSFASEREKWLFVGEAKGRLKLFSDTTPVAAFSVETRSASEIQSEIDTISVRDVEETRDAIISVINEITLALLKETGEALANYAKYQTDFAYKEKRLRLRKPRSRLIENVGSSSNHMFLHLLQFLALHEVAIIHQSPFVPKFLIIDQPSRPYYPDDKPKDDVVLANSDSEKVQIAFQLLNNFAARMNKQYGSNFQMIVLEHVPKDTFDGMEFVYVLPEFRNGEALIPASWQ
ncbi:DUF3732 domain-containing protein [Comamonas endophytica]|uniref:DUF3732 domain-containing protein n=2 Tax=Comamonas endophytica TaxID=2949090 RepID=A0ABY6GGP3_9BURK|nr:MULTISPECIES: DUF3732 domain-containing protein [unclassified Acidovorax]MCD2514618.1 DUF3732 domain-containing protein [Acidovorax sp. D4N7]UYG54051.1 DUF3732 domain-containing protein [Acidovorax sp. 5MLIR]